MDTCQPISGELFILYSLSFIAAHPSHPWYSGPMLSSPNQLSLWRQWWWYIFCHDMDTRWDAKSHALKKWLEYQKNFELIKLVKAQETSSGKKIWVCCHFPPWLWNSFLRAWLLLSINSLAGAWNFHCVSGFHNWNFLLLSFRVVNILIKVKLFQVGNVIHSFKSY